MPSWNLRLPALVLAAAAFCNGAAFGQDQKASPKDVASFGTLSAPTPEAAKKDAAAWLKSVGKTDAATLAKFETIWKSEVTVLDKVTETLCLGDANAAKLLAEARDANAAAPTETPSLLKDTKLPVYYRANLALAYAKAQATRRI